MDTIDSFKIKLSTDTIIDINTDRFDFEHVQQGIRSGEMFDQPRSTVKDKYVLKNLDKGLKLIEYDERNDSLIIEGSAKILHEQYLQGITPNTVQRVFEQINKTGVITLNTSQAIDQAALLRVDITKTLQVEQSTSEYIGVLGLIPVSDRYNIDRWSDESIIFAGKQKTFKERQIFYDKVKDLTKKDSWLLSATGGQNLLRAELNLAQLKRIRYHFGTNMLCDVLNRQVAPNYDLFKKITHRASTEPLQLFDQWQGLPLYQIEKIEGRKAIIKGLGCDIEMIKLFVKSHMGAGSNISSYVKKYRELMTEMMQQAGLKEHKAGYFTKLIDEIKLKLAA